MRKVIWPCQHCGKQIHMLEGVLVDNSGGDVCCGDAFMERNENGKHSPQNPPWKYRSAV